MESSKPTILLDSVEIRVLGSLIEKSKTTPDYYPMTLNAITLACNQKSSRKPIVQYDEETALRAIDNLKRKGLVSMVTGGGSRTFKYKQNFDSVYHFTSAESAVLCLMFLRGPMTPGEINSNSARLHEFASIESVLGVLEKLSQGETPFIRLLPRRAGQKEQRYVHLFSEVQEYGEEEISGEAAKSESGLEKRLEIVEKELAELKASFEKLYKELMG